MALGRKTIEIITENPLQVEEEAEQAQKEYTKEILKLALEYGIKVARIMLSK